MLTLLIISFLVYGVFLLVYYNNIKESVKDFHEESFEREYLPSEFNGLVESKKEYKFSNKSFTVYVVNSFDNEKWTFDVCESDRVLNVGDTLLKYKHDSYLYVKKNGAIAKLSVTFCK